MKRTRKILLLLFCAMFICGIFLPFFFSFVGQSRVSFLERRYLADFPKLPSAPEEFLAFPATFDRYFRDHFGFREQLLLLHYKLVAGPLFSIIRHDALVGKNGWLYWGNEEALIDVRGDMPPPTEKQLDAWFISLQKKQVWLSSLGIPFLFVVAPDKPSIYPEFLPDGIRAPGGASSLDYLVRYLEGKKVDWVLNLKPILLEKKQTAGKRLLYYTSDSHWNRLGAFYAFDAILEKLGRMGVKIPESRFRESDLVPYDWDISGEFLLGDRSGEVPVPGGVWPSPESVECIKNSALMYALPSASPGTVATTCKTGQGRMVLIGDSFAEKMSPYISRTFSRVVYMPIGDNRLNTFPLVEAERPNVVIFEVVERRLRLKGDVWDMVFSKSK